MGSDLPAELWGHIANGGDAHLVKTLRLVSTQAREGVDLYLTHVDLTNVGPWWSTAWVNWLHLLKNVRIVSGRPVDVVTLAKLLKDGSRLPETLKKLPRVKARYEEDSEELLALHKLYGLPLVDIVCSLGPSQVHRLADMHALESLEMAMSDIHDEDLLQLQRLPLQALNFGYCPNLTGATLPKLTGLARLHIFECDGIDDLSFLSETQMLNELSLTYQLSLDDDGLYYVGSCKGLTRLDISYCAGISDQGFRHLANLTKLRELNLRNINISDCAFSVFKSMPSLRRLCIRTKAGVTENSFSYCDGSLQLLESLTLTDASHLTTNRLDFLQMFPSLKELDIGGLKIEKVHIEDLARLGRISSLKLAGRGACDVLSVDFGLGRLTDLKKLEIHWAEIVTTEGLLQLSHLALDSLTLSSCGLSVESVGLLDVPSLTSICIHNTPLPDAALPNFSRFPRLRILRFPSCLAFTENVLNGAEGLGSLEILEIHIPKPSSRGRLRPEALVVTPSAAATSAS